MFCGHEVDWQNTHKLMTTAVLCVWLNWHFELMIAKEIKGCRKLAMTLLTQPMTLNVFSIYTRTQTKQTVNFQIYPWYHFQKVWLSVKKTEWTDGQNRETNTFQLDVFSALPDEFGWLSFKSEDTSTFKVIPAAIGCKKKQFFLDLDTKSNQMQE